MPETRVQLTRARAFGNRATDMRVDWFRLFMDLRGEGYSLYDISHFTKIPKSTLIGYKQGSHPVYHQGVVLVEFWSQATGKQPELVPMVSKFSHTA